MLRTTEPTPSNAKSAAGRVSDPCLTTRRIRPRTLGRLRRRQQQPQSRAPSQTTASASHPRMSRRCASTNSSRTRRPGVPQARKLAVKAGCCWTRAVCRCWRSISIGSCRRLRNDLTRCVLPSLPSLLPPHIQVMPVTSTRFLFYSPSPTLTPKIYVSRSSIAPPKPPPRPSTTARDTRSRWPMPRSPASAPSYTRSTSSRRSSIRSNG